MDEIPFLKPRLVSKDALTGYLEQIDATRIYSNHGPLNKRVEERILRRFFSDEGAVVTVNNATTGLMLAIMQVKRAGKYALMPSFTFSATPLSAMWCGLEPYFIDIDPERWCLNERQLEEALQKLGDEVAVVVPYAAFGAELNLEYYESLRRSGVPVVIDAASSFGCMRDDQFGRGFKGAVVFSFHATKLFGIGEGGLIYSADETLIHRLRQSSNFGFDQNRESRQIGLNGKVSEYAAAIALATLEVVDEKIIARERIADWYRAELQDAGMLFKGWKLQEGGGKIPYQFFPLLCPPKHDHRFYLSKLQAAGIQARTYFSPSCHEQPLFQRSPHSDLSVTEDVCRRILSLPVWEDIEQAQVQRIVRCLADE
ncbi:DegT/DnrJ/EryC1/StrS family aminotransferase [Cohnella zeiphila]|uniref:DegT/DnrJ/EryC1/StrS family aminotransferase n=1 Tax=Cohnella zeiphila TaxID=2761120 RepID=A0A7X0SVA4_9BACL|nr:aminotransferase class I/II-fold pyridoxal phosphate-dependent enzyme [Cohnella zeiphila]MBB6734523.1 DegT/DnrJ/EryC1/StrS family aminotransferase [Cohnella zeiphila]